MSAAGNFLGWVGWLESSGMKHVPEFKYALAALNDTKRQLNHGGSDVA
jgi:hypothetical protein